MLVYVVLALFLGVVNCQDAPKKCSDWVGTKFITPDVLLAHSPFKLRVNVRTEFNCGQLYFVRGRYNSSDANDGIITNSDNNQVTVFKLTPNQPKNAYTATDCTGPTGKNLTLDLNIVEHKIDGNAFLVCATACAPDGINFFMAFCLSNNDGFKSEIDAFVDKVKGTANGGEIHESQANCKQKCPDCAFTPVN